MTTNPTDPVRSIAGIKGALRYVCAYRDQIFVIKLGGEVLRQPESLASIAAQIALLASLGVRLVVAHGGGPQVSALSQTLGIIPQIITGRRVTCKNTLEVVKMVIGGQLNLSVLAALRAHRVLAVGLSGMDGELVTARRQPPVQMRDDRGQLTEVDFGLVGNVETVDPRPLQALLAAGYMPVVASLAGDNEGNIYNLNADTLAEHLALALRAQKLIFLTSAPGVLRDPDDSTTLVTLADPDDLASLLHSGAIAGGMRPKVEACIRAATGGVERTHIVDGRTADALLCEVFTDAGCGTMIVGRKQKAAYLGVDPAEPAAG
ncbi:MAG TPA: acetylglutamate kinase [Pseudomonadota bacterium]|nr:acetylglutamate kinase [Pseudomonadota bacterium]